MDIARPDYEEPISENQIGNDKFGKPAEENAKSAEQKVGSDGGMVVQFQNYHQRYVEWVRRLRGEHLERSDKAPRKATLLHKCCAEAFGAGFIVLTGVGVVNAAVFTGAQQGIWQVLVVWGFGVTLAILCTATVSGAHLNPAVSLAFAILRPDHFHIANLLPYWFAQFFGAFIAALINYCIFRNLIHDFEMRHGIVRGEEASVLSAQAFGEYYPNPGFQYGGTEQTINGTQLKIGALQWNEDTVTTSGAFGAEAFGTAILMLVILAVTDERNSALKSKELAPFFIGFTVAVVMSLYAPMTQGGLNPARDFGPRLAAYFLGWDEVAIPGPREGAWIYVIGPMFGAPLGGAFYDMVLRPP